MGEHPFARPQSAGKLDQPPPLVGDWRALNLNTDWFTDPARPAEDALGPHVIVIDDFYPPEEAILIRAQALSTPFRRYCPPEPGQIEESGETSLPPGTWYSTSVVYFRGRPVNHPFEGRRFNPEWLRLRFEAAIGEAVDPATWDTLGDRWNGAFHLIEADWKSERGSIHHHYKAFDVTSRGWSGLVYLSPAAPPSAGTTIWRERVTGRCIAAFGAKFAPDLRDFELALSVENRFNRLVLFRENVLHRAEHGFGRGKDARLTQTFFFRSARRPHENDQVKA